MTLHEALDLLTINVLKQRRALIPSGDRSTRKSDIVTAIARYLLSADLGAVWARLSELEIDAVAESVHCWGGAFDPVRFRAKYGAIPSHFEPHAYSWREQEC